MIPKSVERTLQALATKLEEGEIDILRDTWEFLLDSENLETKLVLRKLPRVLALIKSLYGKYKAQYEGMESELRKYAAIRYRESRASLAGLGVAKITETMVRREVESTPEYQALLDKKDWLHSLSEHLSSIYEGVNCLQYQSTEWSKNERQENEAMLHEDTWKE